MNPIHRTRPGHWADQPNAHGVEYREGAFVFSPVGNNKQQRFPFWPFALCIGFPFLVALVVWLVLSSLKG